MTELLHTISWVVIVHIIVIDLLLSADNAVAISLACRHLSPAQRLKGIAIGTFFAVALRVALVFVALNLLAIAGLKLIGGLLLMWVAVRLLARAEPDHTRLAVGGGAGAGVGAGAGLGAGASLAAAIKTVVVADFIMSLDNVLAVAGAVHNGAMGLSASSQLTLVVIGLLFSVPVIIWGSSLLIKLMDRFPVVVLAGVGLLGWVAGGMMLTDKLVLDQVGQMPVLATLLIQAVFAVTAMLLGRKMAK